MDTNFVQNSIKSNDAKIPLYAQVKTYILQKIQSGEWVTGCLIPSEIELQGLLNVSKITIRHAISELANEGYLIKKQGKGTFVSIPKLSYDLPKLTSFSEDMKNKGYNPSSKTLTIKIAPFQSIASKLGIPDETMFLYLRRLRIINNNIILGIHDCYINLNLLNYDKVRNDIASNKLVENLDINNISLYNIIEQEHKVEICYADEFLEAISCSTEFAQLLGIKRKDPIVFLERITYSKNDVPLEYVLMYNRADIYKYSVRLTR